jgi:hypothetical protein
LHQGRNKEELAENRSLELRVIRRGVDYFYLLKTLNNLKTKYLNVGRDIQKIKLEHKIKIKCSGSFKDLGSIFTNAGKRNEEVLNRPKQARPKQEHQIAYFGVNIFR